MIRAIKNFHSYCNEMRDTVRSVDDSAKTRKVGAAFGLIAVIGLGGAGSLAVESEHIVDNSLSKLQDGPSVLQQELLVAKGGLGGGAALSMAISIGLLGLEASGISYVACKRSSESAE